MDWGGYLRVYIDFCLPSSRSLAALFWQGIIVETAWMDSQGLNVYTPHAVSVVVRNLGVHDGLNTSTLVLNLVTLFE